MQFYNQFGYKAAWQLGSSISKEKEVPKTLAYLCHYYKERQADKKSVPDENRRHLVYAWKHQPHLQRTRDPSIKYWSEESWFCQ